VRRVIREKNLHLFLTTALLCLVSGLALAGGLGGGGLGDGSGGFTGSYTGDATFTGTVTGGGFSPSSDSAIDLGTTALRFRRLYLVSLRDSADQDRITGINATAQSTNYFGTVADSGSNAAHKFGNTASLTSTRRIMEWHNDSAMGTAEAYIDASGGWNGATISGTLLDLSNAAIGLRMGTTGSAMTMTGSTTTGITLTGKAANGATARGLIVNANTALSDDSSGLLDLRNNATTKYLVDEDGSRLGTRVTLKTCAAAYEGMVSLDVASGSTTTSKRTKFCLCTSDGAASPAYAWQNLATGTLGNTTTCGSE
jgi:hypothetical protein